MRSRSGHMILFAILLVAMLMVPSWGKISGLIDIDLGVDLVGCGRYQRTDPDRLDHPDRASRDPSPPAFPLLCTGGAFVVANISIPGVWLIGLGGLSNLDRHRFERRSDACGKRSLSVGRDEVSHGRVRELRRGRGSQAAVPRRHLLYPTRGKPVLNTVFNVGDVLIAIGTVVLVHGVSGSRLVWWRGHEEDPTETTQG